MRHAKSLLLLLLATLLTASLPGCPILAHGIYFDDSAPDIMVLGNSIYEVGFYKSNGGIAYITDKATGGRVSEGSRHECLWGAYGASGYIGGCNYNAAWPNHFSYTWSATTRTLTLTYTPDPAAARRATTQVVIVASEDNYFDAHLQLQSDWGDTLDYVLFPSDMVFREADIRQALLPMLPGVALEPAFFAQNRSYLGKYPGEWFADYVAVSSAKGELAVYSLYGTGPIRPLFLGFIHDEEYLPDSTFYYHTFGARVAHGGTWTSPWVRFRASRSPSETIRAYRTDNGTDRFRSLPEKLGRRYAQVAQSPLFKADTIQLNVPFAQYPALLARVPAPGILHPVAFQPRGFDENYPDFLPPDPRWGTTADMAAMFRQAQGMGFTVMPYTNPTWWDDESPTLRNLPPPLTITDIALAETPGVPRYEYYGPRGGYVVSPYSPFVQYRLAQLVFAMTNDVPSDMLFEDQIGARPWLFDHNPFSLSPTAYPDGWLAHTRAYSPALLMTEMGFDRLAETEVGFHGGVLLSERRGYTVDWWGTGTWHPYPLAPMLARDKVLFYQHDLAEDVMTVDKATLSWNLAFGYMLSYDLGYGGGLDNPWLEVVSAFQRHVLARYADERMTGYVDLGNNVTRSDFEHTTVIMNWDKVNPYRIDRYVLPPEGALAYTDDGSLTAGIFTAYNDTPLSSGDHYLIEERASTEIIVRQPMGADTDLTAVSLPDWDSTQLVQVWAYGKDGRPIQRVPATVSPQGATFTYEQQVAGQAAAYYKITAAYESFVPAVWHGR